MFVFLQHFIHDVLLVFVGTCLKCKHFSHLIIFWAVKCWLGLFLFWWQFPSTYTQIFQIYIFSTFFVLAVANVWVNKKTQQYKQLVASSRTSHRIRYFNYNQNTSQNLHFFYLSLLIFFAKIFNFFLFF